MKEEFDLHELAVEYARYGHQRPKIEEYGDSVFVVAERAREDGGKELAVTRHYVQLGPRRNGRVAVTEGVAAGELVVTAGALKLDAGTVVTIDNSVKLSR